MDSRAIGIHTTSRLTVANKRAKQHIVLEEISRGTTNAAAYRAAGVSAQAFYYWRSHDEYFRLAYENALLGRKMPQIQRPRPASVPATPNRRGVPAFDIFRRRYLHQPLFPLHYNMWDAIEGREPRYLAPSMVYEPHEPTRVLINVPPNHGKTTCFAIDYPVWLINCNPSISIAIISKSAAYARKILLAIKVRLTSNTYRDMHRNFAPSIDGWKDPDGSWTQNQIYVAGKYDGQTEKEPTVEAVGLGTQIYGGRFDVIICDDVIDLENVTNYVKQADTVMTTMDSRLPPRGGKMIVLGTRMASMDLYAELRSKENEHGDQFFTYLSQPAVLEYGQTPAEWRTLWPYEATDDANPEAKKRCLRCLGTPGRCRCSTNLKDFVKMVPRWTGPLLAKKRYPLGERRWSLVWQQQQLPDDAVFNYETIVTAVDPGRMPGKLNAAYRENGSTDLYMVGGLDPATVGNTSIIVAGLDRFTGKRWVLDGFDKANTSPATMRRMIQEFTEKYNINEWVIERNAFQKFLTDDLELRRYLQNRGAKLTPHFTGSEKRDEDFGVMSMAPLFESTGRPAPQNGKYMRVRNGSERIVLPDARQHAWVARLIQQLAAWEPSGMSVRQKTDIVMALWFTEIAFKRILSIGQQPHMYVDNPFATKMRIKTRNVIDLVDLRARLAAQETDELVQ